MKYGRTSHTFTDWSFADVASAFWQRYPNTYSRHVLSEDIIHREITATHIYTRRIIVKQWMSKVPSALRRLVPFRIVPTIEESIFDREHSTLRTYTRNATHLNWFSLDERCIYRTPDDGIGTLLQRDAWLVLQPRHWLTAAMSARLETTCYVLYNKSTAKTIRGFEEKLNERAKSAAGDS